MDTPTNQYWAERIESLKAGAFSAVATSFCFGLTIVIHQTFALVNLPVANAQPFVASWGWVVSWAIAALSGFLFGVTYRYIIRQDQNPHLKTGAVMAFGLVRGLAQTDLGLSIGSSWLPLALGVPESILLFAVARLVTDWALHQGWVKPFQ
jgi:hypothetical protein